MKAKKLCTAAVFAAFVFIVTRFIQIPIPLGYFNIGNCIILLSCLFVPMPYGIAVGAIGSALADLTSYPVYTIPTLIIKGIMPLVFYLIYKIKKNQVFAITGAAVSTLIPLFGYTVTGMILYGSFYTGLAQFPGLLVEYGANLIIFIIFLKTVYKRLKDFNV